MAKLPEPSLVERIDGIVHESYPRPHLGASQIGNPCQRYLVYTFNWTYKNKVTARSERIFRLGDAIEQLIINALKSIGIKHFDGQLRILDELGFFGGSIDGKVTNIPGYGEEVMLFEAKSAKQSNFNKFRASRLQEANALYYSQVQSYMHHLWLKNTLFCVMNKDTSELHIEIVPYNVDKAIMLNTIEEAVITAQHINEFDKLSNNPAWFECKFCSARGVCHGNDQPLSNCRTCEYREYHMGGKVYCNKHDKELNADEQALGCNSYELNSMWR